jgi:spore maturation protein CgeB
MLDRLARFRADATLDPAIDHLLSTPTLFIDATMRTRAVERAERAFTISWLSRRFSCATFGPADFSAWACRARAFGPVAYEDQPRLYSRGRFGLNVMRWQDDAGLNLKCYEITASGAACLLARRPGLEELFDPHSEVAAFDSPRHAATLARELLDSPRRLQALAESGRARTLRDHTWTSWARAVAETLARMRS